MSSNKLDKVISIKGIQSEEDDDCCQSHIIEVPHEKLSKCNDGSDCLKVDSLYVQSPIPIPIDTPMSSNLDNIRKLCAEGLGTMILLNVIVGSGIMAQMLSPNDVGLQLLEKLLENACVVCAGISRADINVWSCIWCTF